jgi:enoyl-CoA hydratase/carnithine racemase
MQGMVRALVDFPVPTVAAIDGPAIGLGFDLALACDSRLIGPQGWCMQGWGRIGVVPGTGGEYLLRLRAPSLLWRLLETQPRIYAVDAERWNIGESTNDDPARVRAVARINSYAQMSRDALVAYADLHRMDLRKGLDEHLEAAVNRQVKLLASPDLKGKVDKLLMK